MAKETRAIVIVFTGEEPANKDFVQIGAYLASSLGATGDCPCFAYSAEEIAKMAISHIKVENVDKTPRESEQKTPEDEAIIYLGTVMEENLKKPYNGYDFFTALIIKMEELRTSSTIAAKEAHKQFMNALFILSQENLVISKTLMKKYHFSQEKIATIKKVYNFVTRL